MIKIPRVKVKGEQRPTQQQLKRWYYRQGKIRKFIAIRAKKDGIMKARVAAIETFGREWRDELPDLELLKKYKI